MFNILGINQQVLRTEKRGAIITFYTDVLDCYLEQETSPETGLTRLTGNSDLIGTVGFHSQLGRQGCGAPTETDNNPDHPCLPISPIDEDKICAHLALRGIEYCEIMRR
ncbi:hypothetical protein GCE9029_02383 [Grimontia celer]|uniref:Glyoxalase-like domain protein n=1 Tax=Grimontia celer TaxID=1796497 RepID=A0A128F2Q5_9GAMM|nr:hypothetical protein [Grimontia celer]CZF81078.1 hypothetical protein GCE9029_02383 [Grimontia celer]